METYKLFGWEKISGHKNGPSNPVRAAASVPSVHAHVVSPSDSFQDNLLTLNTNYHSALMH